MEFNQLVIEKILPLFKVYGYVVTERYKNYFHFKSNTVEATISYNELDRGSLFEIGKANGVLYSLDDQSILKVFNLNINIIIMLILKFLLIMLHCF